MERLYPHRGRRAGVNVLPTERAVRWIASGSDQYHRSQGLARAASPRQSFFAYMQECS
jgi:hypothetical protein